MGFCLIFPVETGRWYPVQQVLLLGNPPLGFLSADWLSSGLSRSKQLSNMFLLCTWKKNFCRPERGSCCIWDFSVSFEITLFDRGKYEVCSLGTRWQRQRICSDRRQTRTRRSWQGKSIDDLNELKFANICPMLCLRLCAVLVLVYSVFCRLARS